MIIIVIPIDTEYQHPSVAGPRQKRHKKRVGISSNKSSDNSQSSVSSTSSLLLQRSTENSSSIKRGRERGRERGRRNVGRGGHMMSSTMTVSSTSESEQSDTDISSINLK